MKKQVLFLLSFLLLNCFSAQEKHALLIGISDYLNYPDAHPLSASNDMVLIEDMLSKQEFPASNIIKVYEENATQEGMHQGFKKLLTRVSNEDIVYFHFSGHGCQIPDIGDTDEDDGHDEVMMPYDSPKLDEYDSEFMEKVEVFFTDDEFNYYLNRLREKLGKQGQIVVVMDCCHSGTGTRDLSSKKISRGLLKPIVPKGYKPEIKTETSWSAMDNKHANSDDLAGLTSFYGCRADQINWEYPYNPNIPSEYGSLTYFLCTALNSLDENPTYRNLFSKIVELHEKRRLPNQFQDMLYESDNKDALLFSGEFVSQKNFLKLRELNQSRAILSAGSIHDLHVGDTIGFFDNAEMNFERSAALFFGLVAKTTISTSEVNLLEFQENVSRRDYLGYRARRVGIANEDTKLKVSFEFDDQNAKKNQRELTAQLGDLDFLEYVDNDGDIYILDTLINDEPHAVLKLASNGKVVRNNIFSLKNSIEISCLKESLRAEASIKSFLTTKTRIDDPDIQVDVRFEGIDTTIVGAFPISLDLINNSKDDLYWKILFIDPLHSVYHVEWDLPILKKNEKINMILKNPKMWDGLAMEVIVVKYELYSCFQITK